MVTTIQLNEKTLLLLKKLKEEFMSKSYEEAITKLVAERMKSKSMAGSLEKYYKNISLKKIIKDLQDERKKNERF